MNEARPSPTRCRPPSRGREGRTSKREARPPEPGIGGSAALSSPPAPARSAGVLRRAAYGAPGSPARLLFRPRQRSGLQLRFARNAAATGPALPSMRPTPPARPQALQLERRSVAVAVGQRVRHSARRGRRPLDVWKGDRSGARWSTELNAVDLDVVALAGALEHVVERVASVAERVGSVGNDDRRLELHARSIARPR